LNLSDIIREIGELSLRSPALESDYRSIVNRAQRAIAERNNWSFMYSIQTATIAAGTTSIALSSRFKELAPEKSPVTYTDAGEGRQIPVIVLSRAEIDRLNRTGGFPYVRPVVYVFIEQVDDGSYKLNIPSPNPAAANTAFQLACYLFPADLALGTDTNGMTTGGELTQALINKAKEIAYFSEDTTDPRGVAANKLYEYHVTQAGKQDSRRKLAGRNFHW
jgi:hypothetical protein